jgi:hypothetical protein
MPAAIYPPADLSPTELKAVVAFLESMGGEVTSRVLPEDVVAAKAKAPAPAGVGPAETYLSERGCTSCHDVRGESRRIGPPLTSVAKRSRQDIRRRSWIPTRSWRRPCSGLMPDVRDLKPGVPC